MDSSAVNDMLRRESSANLKQAFRPRSLDFPRAGYAGIIPRGRSDRQDHIVQVRTTHGVGKDEDLSRAEPSPGSTGGRRISDSRSIGEAAPDAECPPALGRSGSEERVLETASRTAGVRRPRSRPSPEGMARSAEQCPARARGVVVDVFPGSTRHAGTRMASGAVGVDPTENSSIAAGFAQPGRPRRASRPPADDRGDLPGLPARAMAAVREDAVASPRHGGQPLRHLPGGSRSNAHPMEPGVHLEHT